MLGGVFVVFGYCLRRAGPSQSAGSSDPGHSQASRPRPACWAAALRLLSGAIPGPPDWDFGEFRAADELKNDF